MRKSIFSQNSEMKIVYQKRCAFSSPLSHERQARLVFSFSNVIFAYANVSLYTLCRYTYAERDVLPLRENVCKTKCQKRVRNCCKLWETTVAAEFFCEFINFTRKLKPCNIHCLHTARKDARVNRTQPQREQCRVDCHAICKYFSHLPFNNIHDFASVEINFSSALQVVQFGKNRKEQECKRGNVSDATELKIASTLLPRHDANEQG